MKKIRSCRRGYFTIDHIQSLYQIIERTREYINMEVDLVFVDFRKAFDTVNHKYISTALWEQGIGSKI